MSYIPLEKILDKADDSMYRLVILAAKRALEVAEGMPPLVETAPESKSTTVALLELADNKVRCKPKD